MTKREILLVMSAPDGLARGNVCRITAKKTDYYLDFAGTSNGSVHLSFHGPNDKFDGHRFHIKVDREAVKKERGQGRFFEHTVPRGGQSFNGIQLAENAFLVARLRWTWDLQRPRFKDSSLSRTSMPVLTDARSGKKLDSSLKPNSAWDIDIVISYGKPYSSDLSGKEYGDSKIGPLPNGAGMFLTARSHHRSQLQKPSPGQLQLPLPAAGEPATSILAGGLGPNSMDDIYWLVQGITSTKQLERIASNERHRASSRTGH